MRWLEQRRYLERGSLRGLEIAVLKEGVVNAVWGQLYRFCRFPGLDAPSIALHWVVSGTLSYTQDHVQVIPLPNDAFIPALCHCALPARTRGHGKI